MKYVPPKFVAQEYSVTTQTVRRWISAGKFEHIAYTAGGHARIGISSGSIVGYARVSSKKQVSSIEAQIKGKYPECECLSDIASGFNFKRRGLKTILERCLRGDAVKVVVSDQDRLSRTGFEFIRYIVESKGGEVVILNKGGEEPGQFDMSTLVGFITSFCNSHYGKRSSRRKKDSHLPRE